MRGNAVGQKQLLKYSVHILRHLALGRWESSQSLTGPHGYKDSAFTGGAPLRPATKALYRSESSIAKRLASKSGMKNRRPSAERATTPGLWCEWPRPVRYIGLWRVEDQW